MGIKDFRSHIKKIYPNACKARWLNSYDNLYIELNYLLHHICYSSKNIDDLLIKTKDYLSNIVNCYKPTKRIILVADGIAPLAKLLLQRKRRLDMIKYTFNIPNIEQNIKQDIEQDNIQDNIQDIEQDIRQDIKQDIANKLLNLNFTPGTHFMINLENSISDFTRFLKNKHKLEVIVDITNPDEGELKIKRILQDFDNNYPNQTHIIYSGDSDMVILLFTCPNIHNIYQVFGKNNIISLGELYNKHIEKYGKTNTTKYDFAFIHLLMGNDYIPKVKYIKLEKIWTVYKRLSPFYQNGLVIYKTNSITIDGNFFHDLMYFATMDTPKHFMRFHIKDVTKSMYKKYLDGIVWCLRMYISGQSNNYHYIYDFDESPHITGIILTILTGYNVFHFLTETQSYKVETNLYGILIIPEKAQSLLSEEQLAITKLLIEKYPIIYDEQSCFKCYKLSSKILINNKKCKIINNIITRNNEQNDVSDGLINKYINYKNVLVKNNKILSTQLANHKETHNKLTLEIIENIVISYEECKQKINDGIKKYAKHSINKKDKNKVYKPCTYGMKDIKKKLF